MEHTGHLNKVVFKDFYKLELEILYAVLPFIQHSTIPVYLGCELTNQGYIKVDNFLKTSVKGVYACGDNASMIRSVSSAIASENLAGAMVNNEITDETF